MLKQFNLKDFLLHGIQSIKAVIAAPQFIYDNKLWTGFFKHKGIGLIALIISAIFSFFVIGDIMASIQSWFTPDTVTSTTEMNVAGIPIEIQDEGRKALFSGGSKYLLLILMEVVIFYFSVKTLSILKKSERNPTFKEFMSAEKRMIKVMFYNFLKGIFALVIVSIALGLVGLGGVKHIVMFFVYSYFLGYAFLDNYNEQFEKTIKESQRIIRTQFGGALALGIFSNVFLYIPLLGPFMVPIIGAIAASLYGAQQKMELA